MKNTLRSLGSVRWLGCASVAALTALVACSASLDDDGNNSPTAGTGGAKGGSAGAGPSGGAGFSTGGGGGSAPLGGFGVAGTSTTQGGRGGQGGQGGQVTGGAPPFGGGGGTFPLGGAGGRGGGQGGRGGTGQGGGSAGQGGQGGQGGSGGSASTTDPCSVTTLPTGGQEHASNNQQGMAAGLTWTIWSNVNSGSITTFSVPAFSAKWNNAGDFLARIGLQWNNTKTYDQYGTITAQFNSKKSGSAGGYSYIGIYGWSVEPCVEFYIVDDSWNRMPVNPGMTNNKGTANIDGGTYTLYTRDTTGTGGSKCPGTSQWAQYYSIRQSARSCGQISVTAHFDAWKAAGMPLGKMDQAQILVEVGGGQGSIEFPVANVTATTP